MRRCGKLNGSCVHQDMETCDGCQLMEMWLKYKDKSIELDKKYQEDQRNLIDSMNKHNASYAC